MQYFIDHSKKRIHKRQYAGDRCGFIGTTVDNREFTDSGTYIEELEKQGYYEKCPYCRTAQPIINE